MTDPGTLAAANGKYDCLVGAVPHREYRDLGAATFAQLLNPGGLVADIKGMWRQVELSDGLARWEP